jgi:hypothetical protein
MTLGYFPGDPQPHTPYDGCGECVAHHRDVTIRQRLTGDTAARAAVQSALLALLPVIRTRIGAVSPQDIAAMRAALGLPALDDDTLQAQADEAQRVALRASILPRGGAR